MMKGGIYSHLLNPTFFKFNSQAYNIFNKKASLEILIHDIIYSLHQIGFILEWNNQAYRMDIFGSMHTLSAHQLSRTAS